jgi:hypothetical protein
MITEDYVSYETAKLLKEKGFDVDECEVHYDPEDHTQYDITLQMAVKWLMEKKGIAIIPVLSSILDNEKFLWDIKIVVAKTGERYSQGWIYEKQEEAFDTAIKYCLESLI